jgi:hypothetical protein
VHGVVVIHRDRHTARALEFEDGHGLVRRTLAIRALPPSSGLGIDDLAIDVDVRETRPVAYTGRRQLLFGKTYRLDDLLRILGPSLCAGAMGMCRGEEHVPSGYPELLLNLPGDGLPDRVRYPAGIDRDERRHRTSALEDDCSRVETIENATAVLGKLTGRRRDVHLSRSYAKSRLLCLLCDSVTWDRPQNNQRSDYPGAHEEDSNLAR